MVKLELRKTFTVQPVMVIFCPKLVPRHANSSPMDAGAITVIKNGPNFYTLERASDRLSNG
jgi:hypothetical protein